MQVWFGGVSGVAHQSHDVSAPDPVAHLHPDLARLEVGVERVAAPSQVQNHMVAAYGFQGDGYGP